MKKTWMEPKIMVQEFVANEYVAACYKIKCTTPNNNGSYTRLYNDTNGNGTWDSKDQLVYSSGGFHGCNKWHKGIIRDSAPTANGFVVRSEKTGGTWLKPEYEDVAESVFWWEEKLGSSIDYHSMVPGTENYESNPNAS